jgi:probable F420-dependent oxidoreductase
MDFGFSIPTRGAVATTETIDAFAKRGEALGFRYFAIADHIVIPQSIASPYPYTNDRKMTGAASGDCLDPLSVMAYLAASTTKARLLTSVMVIPHRQPVVAAKMLATIDVLSGGRVTVGCGAGWMAEEFAAIGAPPFAERGKVTDEYLAIFKELWTNDTPRFEGKYARFSNISFLPKPVQKPHPPLWIGGESPAAMRRAARIGDGWYPVGSNPEYPLNTIARYRAAVASLRGQAEQNGRNGASIDLAYWANWYRENQTVTTEDGERHLMTGSTDAVVDDIGRLGEVGVKHCLLNFQRSTLAASLEAMERFAADVLPKVARR